MHRQAIFLLGAALLTTQAGWTAPPKARVDLVAHTPALSAAEGARHPLRPFTLVEQGHTDRIIIVWKGATAKRAAAAARDSALPSPVKAAAQESVRARAEQFDPGRLQRLERLRALAAKSTAIQQRDLTLVPRRRMADGAEVMQLNARISPTEIAALRRQILADPDVADVLPDRLFFPQLTPNDPRYVNDEQWALNGTHGINAPTAWDIATGNPGLVIGVLDTGKLEHSDLAGRWIGGYDFVSLSERSNDGNVRDADATDPGDWVTAAEAVSGLFVIEVAVYHTRDIGRYNDIRI